MPNESNTRKRPHRLITWADNDELALLRERMQASGVTSMSTYLRKMGIDGVHVSVDLSDVRELVSLLRRCSNNLNQIARRANETRNIYQADIDDLRQRYNELWDAANSVLFALGKLA